MGVVFHREMNDYFNSMLGYVFIGMFLFLSGLMFASNNILQLNSSFNTTLNNCIYVFIFTAPLLTMRLVAEEKRTKRDQLLMTSGLSLSAIILGKYFAAFLVYAIAVGFTVLYPIILVIFGNPQIAMIFDGYIGLLFCGAAIISIGLFVSVLTENQLSAAMGTYGLLLLFIMLDLIIPYVQNSALVTMLEWLSLFRRFAAFHYGTLSLSSIVYYLAFTSVFVFLSAMMLERRRWQKT